MLCANHKRGTGDISERRRAGSRQRGFLQWILRCKLASTSECLQAGGVIRNAQGKGPDSVALATSNRALQLQL